MNFPKGPTNFFLLPFTRFYAVPKMYFHQRTSNDSSRSELKIKTSRNRLYTPHSHIVSYLYWIFISIFFVLTFIPLMFSAISEQNNNHKLGDIFYGIHLLMYPIAFGMLIVLLIYYG